jgi:hypothetical protein
MSSVIGFVVFRPSLTFILVASVIVVVAAVIAWLVRDELSQIAGLLWTVWCFVFIIRWKLRFLLRNFLVQTTLGVLLVTGFYLVIELGVAFLRHVGIAPWDWGNGHRLILFSELPAPPLSIEVVLLVLAFLIARHRWHEWKISRRQSKLPPALQKLLVEFDEFRKVSPKPDPAKKKAFLEVVLKRFKGVLDVGSKKGMVISLMEIPSGGDGKLTITFVHPAGSPIDADLKLAVGQGGAGKAYEKKVSIYIPSVRHVVGINVATKRSEGVRYEPSQNKDPFRSILSVPVVASDEVIAVVTFSARKRSAFYPEDFEIASLAATLVSMFY